LVSKEVGDDIPLEAAEVWQTVFSVLHTVAAQRALLLRELTLHEVTLTLNPGGLPVPQQYLHHPPGISLYIQTYD